MAKKYEYSLNEIPPAGHLLALSFQHIMLMVMSLTLPIIFASQLNASPEFTSALIAFSMISAGIGSILQSLRFRYLGSGYLCPNLCGPSYFSLSLSAAWTGGLPLMRGIIIVAGIIEMIMAPLIQKLKRVFPGYIVGLVVAMVGISVISSAVSSFFGIAYFEDSINNNAILIGFITLMIMVLSNVWGKGFLKMYCLLIGMIAGWITALILVPDYMHDLLIVKESSWFAFPSYSSKFLDIKFDLKLLLPVLVVGISGSIKSFGNLLAAQKISEPDLKKLNFKPLRNGLMTDGLSTLLSGVLGGMAVDTSSSNIGLAAATRITSRWICFTAGIIFTFLAFFPKLLLALSVMPKPVLGASVIFSGCFMICTGLIEMFNEKWDPRKTFVIGISLFFGLSTGFLPSLYARAPHFIQAFFTDPLPTSTIIAVLMHQIINLDQWFTGKKE